MPGIPETDRAYAAGLFDGEGCVELFMRTTGLNKAGNRDNSVRAALSVTGKDQRPLQWLLDTFGGYIQISTHPKKVHHSPVGRWSVTASKADLFAAAIHPYLRVKQEQLDVWMEVRTLMYRRGRIRGVRVLPDEEVARRRDLVARLRELKKTARQPNGALWPTL